MISRAAGAARRRNHARFQSGWWFSTTGIRRHDSGNRRKIKELSFGGRSANNPLVKVLSAAATILTIGIALGLAFAVGVATLMRGLLFGVSSWREDRDAAASEGDRRKSRAREKAEGDV